MSYNKFVIYIVLISRRFWKLWMGDFLYLIYPERAVILTRKGTDVSLWVRDRFLVTQHVTQGGLNLRPFRGHLSHCVIWNHGNCYIYKYEEMLKIHNNLHTYCRRKLKFIFINTYKYKMSLFKNISNKYATLNWYRFLYYGEIRCNKLICTLFKSKQSICLRAFCKCTSFIQM